MSSYCCHGHALRPSPRPCRMFFVMSGDGVVSSSLAANCSGRTHVLWSERLQPVTILYDSWRRATGHWWSRAGFWDGKMFFFGEFFGVFKHWLNFLNSTRPVCSLCPEKTVSVERQRNHNENFHAARYILRDGKWQRSTAVTMLAVFWLAYNFGCQVQTETSIDSLSGTGMNNCQAYRIYDLPNLFVVSSVPEMRRKEDGSERPFGMSTITHVFDSTRCLQCFDTVGLAAGRVCGL